MDPPAKRMRMWRPSEATQTPQPQFRRELSAAQPILNNRNDAVLPTRTINLSDFRRRAFHAYRPGDAIPTLRNKNNGIYLMPRAPIATVTAKVIDVSVVNGGSSTAMTQVQEPSSDLVISLGTLGTVTIPGAATITDAGESLVSDITKITKGGSSETDISSQLTTSANATAVPSGENTVTLTSTSTFTVSYLNGTLVPPPRKTTTKSSSPNRSTTGTVTTDASESDSTSDASNTNVGNAVSSSIAGSGSNGNGGLAGSITTTSNSPQSTSAPPTSGVTLSPQQQQVVGGVVGGVAGVALVLVALLYFLKWYRQRMQKHGRLPDQLTHSTNRPADDDQAIVRPQTTETSRSSIGPIAAIATRLRQIRPFSTNTVASASTQHTLPMGESEKSFQRLSGRKIAPVLATGGDGYGGNYGIFDQSSHHRDFSEGSRHVGSVVDRPFTGQPASMSEPSTPKQSDPFADPPSVDRASYRSPPFSPTNFSRPSYSRDFSPQPQRSQSALSYNQRPFSPVLSAVEGFATLRPSPARTPVTQSPTLPSVHIPQPLSTPPLMSEDVPDLPPVPILSLPPRGSKDRAGHSFGSEGLGASRFSTRTMSGVSGTSRMSSRTGSVGGRFREEI